MRISARLVAATATTLVCASALHAQTVTFQMIPDAFSANDMSPDGRFVVGGTNLGRAYIYDTTTSTMTLLPPGPLEAVAVSDDGTVVLANIIDPAIDDQVAGIWTASTNTWTSLGYLPNALSCPGRSSGYELSADGSVAVGLSWDGCSGRGFRWTQNFGMEELEPLANGANRASVVSANGLLIGGFAQGSFSRTPAIWNAALQGSLIDPPDGDMLGEVFGMNDAGTILLGSDDGAAVAWTDGGATSTTIGNGSILPGWQGIPMDIANDGTIVGFDNLQTLRRAWIRPGDSGPMVDLREYIEGFGGVVPEDVALQVCQAISTDGSRIIGHTAFTGAWMVTIENPASCVGDLDGNGEVGASDLALVLGGWGGPSGDLDGDGTTGPADLALVLGAWGPCTPSVGGCCFGSDCSLMTEAECLAMGGTFLGVSVPCSSTSCANNDACADAIDITAMIDAGVVIGNTSFATPGIFGGADPELPAGSPSCHWSGNPGSAHSTVWYSFTPKFSFATIAVCNSSPLQFVDSTIAIYSGTCGKLVEIACNEDGCSDGFPYYSTVFVETLVPGETYYICVMNAGGWGGSSPGEFALTITAP